MTYLVSLEHTYHMSRVAYRETIISQRFCICFVRKYMMLKEALIWSLRDDDWKLIFFNIVFLHVCHVNFNGSWSF